jgi:hypothetical protein
MDVVSDTLSVAVYNLTHVLGLVSPWYQGALRIISFEFIDLLPLVSLTTALFLRYADGDILPEAF